MIPAEERARFALLILTACAEKSLGAKGHRKSREADVRRPGGYGQRSVAQAASVLRTGLLP